MATAKYSRTDTKGKLYVDCSECERGGSDKDKCSSARYDVLEAGRKEYASLTKRQKRDPMAGPLAATRGMFAVSDRMFNDFMAIRTKARLQRETAQGLLCLPNAEAHGRRSRTVQPLVGSPNQEGKE